MGQSDDIKALVEAAFNKLQNPPARESGRPGFFPNGVDYVLVEAQIGPNDAPLMKFKVEAKGPSPASEVVTLDNGLGSMQLKDGLWQILKLTTSTEIGQVWVNPARDQEHWFYQADLFDASESVRLIKLGNDPGLEATKNYACAKGWHYRQASLSAVSAPNQYGNCK